ncbi:DNA polymerase III subunit delta' [Candidatus Aerophobetes bacterium Ae_b3a]|nr:MAG: DNA polymerase III subunit delta' [Candidatus Aerophobetes bacterium Ae_b3a]
MFNDIKGQAQAIRILQKEIATSSISGAYLFTGPAGVGKTLTALTFAKALNCKKEKMDSCDECSSCQKIEHRNHPDVRIIAPENDSIKIEQIRNLKRESSYKLYEGRKKVWIIEQADKFGLAAANSILKILEEPPPQTVLILISQIKEGLLPTILSRCEVIRFFPLPLQEIEKIIAQQLPQGSNKIHILAKLARGRVEEALHLIKEENTLKIREELLNALRRNMNLEEMFKLAAQWANYKGKELQRFLDMILFWFRDILILGQGGKEWLINYDKVEELAREKDKYSTEEIKRIMETIEKARYYLKSNVSQKLVLESLWLNLKEENLRKPNLTG